MTTYTKDTMIEALRKTVCDILSTVEESGPMKLGRRARAILTFEQEALVEECFRVEETGDEFFPESNDTVHI